MVVVVIALEAATPRRATLLIADRWPEMQTTLVAAIEPRRATSSSWLDLVLGEDRIAGFAQGAASISATGRCAGGVDRRHPLDVVYAMPAPHVTLLGCQTAE